MFSIFRLGTVPKQRPPVGVLWLFAEAKSRALRTIDSAGRVRRVHRRRIVHFDTSNSPAVTATTTETVLSQHEFSATELTAGRVLSYEFGATVTAHNAADTCTVRVRWGTSATPTSNTAILTGDAINVSVNDATIGNGSIHIQSDTRQVHIVAVDNPHATGATRDTTSVCIPFTSTASTAYRIQITAQWSSANVGNSLRSECFALWEDEVGG